MAASTVVASDVSRWEGDDRSAVRLLAGSRPAQGAAELHGGVEIRLKRGWHTYWRYPGDSGVPPVFDFGRSRNVKQVDVLWPAPQRIDEAGNVSIGYVANVVFPLKVVPLDRTKPVALRLKLDYAICERLCVPVEARASIALPGGRNAQDAMLAMAEGRVPKKQSLAAAAALAIKSVRREPGPGRPRAVVDVAAPADVPVNLFVEGSSPKWALPVPSPVAGAPPGLRRFSFELDGAPPGEVYRGATITLTAVTPSAAVEVTTRLD
ncbi:MAG: protein-disulfide reductase DsbD domain-containing protein [Xanthobacteraceae bacterium]